MEKIQRIFTSRPYLIIEFILLCLVVPGTIIGLRYAPFMFTFLWSATLYCFLILRAFHFTSWKELCGWEAVTWAHMKPILIRWLFGCVAMVVFLYFYDPGTMFALWRQRPEILPFILVLYPVISALPQEFIFCSFFFRRYEPFFGKGTGIVIASSVIFSYVHILYINPVAPVISLIGGIIFATTYRKYKSLALVTVEHALYGNALFLIGLGKYFFSGGVN